MSQYTLLEGTNQLIRKHNDEGEKLFRKHGYHIKHPRYRDYYNGMRTGGMTFFNDLGGLLTGLFGNKLNTGIFNNNTQAVNRGPALSYGASAGVDTPGLLETIAGSSFTGGQPNITGNNFGYKVKEFHRLLAHLDMMARRERDPRYGYRPVYIPYPFSIPDQMALPPAADPGPEYIPQEDFLSSRKKWLIGMALALVIVLYIKFRK